VSWVVLNDIYRIRFEFWLLKILMLKHGFPKNASFGASMFDLIKVTFVKVVIHCNFVFYIAHQIVSKQWNFYFFWIFLRGSNRSTKNEKNTFCLKTWGVQTIFSQCSQTAIFIKFGSYEAMGRVYILNKFCDGVMTGLENIKKVKIEFFAAFWRIISTLISITILNSHTILAQNHFFHVRKM